MLSLSSTLLSLSPSFPVDCPKDLVKPAFRCETITSSVVLLFQPTEEEPSKIANDFQQNLSTAIYNGDLQEFLESTTVYIVDIDALESSGSSNVNRNTRAYIAAGAIVGLAMFATIAYFVTKRRGEDSDEIEGLPASTTSSPQLTSDQKSILSVGLWCVLDVTFRRLFQRLDIASKFPSSLGGCGVVLAVLLLASKTSSSSSSTKESKLHRLLSPGAALLAKWLSVFFVPSLVTLPLVGGIESLGGSMEVRNAV